MVSTKHGQTGSHTEVTSPAEPKFKSASLSQVSEPNSQRKPYVALPHPRPVASLARERQGDGSSQCHPARKSSSWRKRAAQDKQKGKDIVPRGKIEYPHTQRGKI
jgi:hypothetical protein